MLDSKMVHQDLRWIDDGLANLADSGREFTVSHAVQKQVRAALADAQEDAAIEAEDVLSQADEALVMG